MRRISLRLASHTHCMSVFCLVSEPTLLLLPPRGASHSPVHSSPPAVRFDGRGPAGGSSFGVCDQHCRWTDLRRVRWTARGRTVRMALLAFDQLFSNCCVRRAYVSPSALAIQACSRLPSERSQNSQL